MSIPALGGVGATSFVPGLPAAAPAAPTAATGEAFSLDLAGSVDRLQAMQATSDELAVRAVTGDLDDVHDYTIASTQAAVAVELTVALRNKAVEAFNEIMRMQA